jgi:membrane protease subunit HflC
VLLAVTLVLGAWAIANSLFAVDVTEYGVVTRFGRIVRVVAEPGPHAKAPFDSMARLDRRLLFSRLVPAEFLTVDKKNIVAESLAVWRIADPGQFLQTLATRSRADERLSDVVLAEFGSILGRYPAVSLISADRAASQYQMILGMIRDRVARFARTAYGVEIVDVDILQLSLPDLNKEHVFERMKAERGKMAKEYRSSGELESKKIIAQAEREKTRIETDAYVQAQRSRAEGDAEASGIYAAAFSRDPEFYKFLRTLQAYEKVLDENTTLFLPAGAEVFEMLRAGTIPKEGTSTSPESHPAAVAHRDDPADSASCPSSDARSPDATASGSLMTWCPGRRP